MASLLADGWFYIASAGLLVSGVLFFFLLGQYRVAAEAADLSEPEASFEAPVTAVRPVYFPDDEPEPVRIAALSAEEMPVPAAEPQIEAPVVEKSRETAGGESPAVEYLHRIKDQLEGLHSEVRDLTDRVNSITGRDEALIERLSELTQVVASLRAAASAPPVEPPAPKRAKKIEAPAPEPIVEPVFTEVPEAAPAPEPVALKLEPNPEPQVESPAVVEVSAPTPTPAAAPVEDPEPDVKPRRGPVWPV